VRRAAPTGNLADDTTDPFREDAAGLLGRGDIVAAAAEEPAAAQQSTAEIQPPAGDDFSLEEPVGSGVAGADSAEPATGADAATASGADDPFAFGQPSDAEPPAAESSASPAAARSGKSGPLGAALRAFTRGLTPKVPSVPVGPEALRGLRGVPVPGGAGSPPDDMALPDAAPAEKTPSPAADEFDDPFADDAGQSN
jgi:hypothetical protein